MEGSLMADPVSNKGPAGGGRRVAGVIMSIAAMITLVVWASQVVNLTIIGYTGVPSIPGEWRPFVSMWNIASDSPDALYQLGGNVALFLPLGLLLPLAWRTAFARLVPTLLTGLLLSSAIEITQATVISGRVSTTDDVILNVLGTFLGWLLWRRLTRIPLCQPCVRRVV
ncbi:vanZ like family protein [bacterium BMS3Bbin02]|nr:vanZ like family protein [bacterium BMS3Bbin02]